MSSPSQSSDDESTYISLSLLLEQGDKVLEYNEDYASRIDSNGFTIINNKLNSRYNLSHEHNTFLFFGILPLPTSKFICKKVMNMFRRTFCRVKPLPCWGTCDAYHHSKTCPYHPLQGGLPYHQVKRSLSMEF